jgi:hypothetical protein
MASRLAMLESILDSWGPQRLANFEYIRDQRFRQSLEADYREMSAAVGAGAWKAVHVLAGSIVEAVLVDYLIEAAQKAGDVKAEEEALKADLAHAIAACRDAGILSEKTANLSSVIKGYRNLIHPGRVGQARGDRIGYTAAQLATKIEGDSATTALLKMHLLPKLSDSEVDQLLLHVLPDRYVAAATSDSGRYSSDALALAEAYRLTFDAVPDALKRKSAKWFAAFVSDQPGWVVNLYEEAFFRAHQLAFFTPADRAIVIDHLLARLSAERSEELFTSTTGMGEWLTPPQVLPVIDSVVSEVAYGTSRELDLAARQWLLDLLNDMPPPAKSAAKRRQKAWEDSFTNKGQPELAKRLSTLVSGLPTVEEDELPF